MAGLTGRPWRFLPPFVRNRGGQHIGETITDHKGQVAYLKTFRLSDAQARRGYLLHTLADADRQLAAAAAALGTTTDELVRRIRVAGFEALLKAHVQPPQRPRTTQETSVTRGSHPGNGREIASCEAALQRPDRSIAAPAKDGFRDVQG